MSEPQLHAPIAPPRLASWGSRVIAWVIDGVIVTFIALALGLGVFGPLFGLSLALDGGDGALSFFGLVAAFLLAAGVITVAVALYAPVCMVLLKGATLGKKAVGITVIRVDGQPVDFVYALIREFAVKGLLVGALSSFMGLAFLIDGLWPLVDEDNRALHDMLVGSLVVQA